MELYIDTARELVALANRLFNLTLAVDESGVREAACLIMGLARKEDKNG